MQTIQYDVSAWLAQAMEAGTIHTSVAWLSSEEPVAVEAFTVATLQAACRQSAPIRRAMHCTFEMDNVHLIGQRDVHPALDPLPEEDEHERSSNSSTSSTSSHTGTSAGCPQASSSNLSLGFELDEETARLAEYYKCLGPMPSDGDSDSD